MFDIFNFFGGIFGYVLFYFLKLFNNYGLAIIVFTVIVNVIMLPMSISQQKHMIKTSRLSKKQLELKKKYGNDKNKYNEELMKLNEKEGISPLGGCLPMILPMIFLIIIFSVVRQPLTNIFHFSNEKVDSAITVLVDSPKMENPSNYAQIDVLKAFPNNPQAFNMFNSEEIKILNDFNDSYNFLGLDLLSTPASGDFQSMLWLIPFLCFVSSVGFSFMSQKLQGNSNQMGKGCSYSMIFLSPLISVFFAIYAPAAVGFYWIISTVIRAGQTAAIYRFYNPQTINAKQEAARIALRIQQENRS